MIKTKVIEAKTLTQSESDKIEKRWLQKEKKIKGIKRLRPVYD